MERTHSSLSRIGWFFLLKKVTFKGIGNAFMRCLSLFYILCKGAYGNIREMPEASADNACPEALVRRLLLLKDAMRYPKSRSDKVSYVNRKLAISLSWPLATRQFQRSASSLESRVRP